MTRSLIICTSPFQVFFLRNMINLYPVGRFDVIYFGALGGNKHLSYFREIAKNADRACYLYPPARFRRFDSYFWRPIWSRFTKYEKIYISIAQPWYMRRLLIPHIEHAEIVSFDDGSGNLVDGGKPIHALEDNFSRNFAKNRGVEMQKVISRIRKHYTFCDTIRNWVDDVELISVELSTGRDSINQKAFEISNLFLGYPYYEHFGLNDVNRLFEHLNARNFHYLPHPRENIEFLRMRLREDLIIESDLIAEDLILSVQGASKDLRLVSPGSTALLTTKSLVRDRVFLDMPRVYPVKPLAKAFGCIIMPFDEFLSPDNVEF